MHEKLPFCFNSLNFSSDWHFLKFAGKLFYKCFLWFLMNLSHIFDCFRLALWGTSLVSIRNVFLRICFSHETWDQVFFKLKILMAKNWCLWRIFNVLSKVKWSSIRDALRDLVPFLYFLYHFYTLLYRFHVVFNVESTWYVCRVRWPAIDKRIYLIGFQ